MNETEIIKQALENIPADNKIYISKMADIADRIQQLLDEKDWTQKDLALAMGKQESEISKWLTTIHNFTLKSISKMEAALGADIINIPLSGEAQSQTRYVYLKVKARSNEMDIPCFKCEDLAGEIQLPKDLNSIIQTNRNDFWPIDTSAFFEEDHNQNYANQLAS